VAVYCKIVLPTAGYGWLAPVAGGSPKMLEILGCAKLENIAYEI